MTGADAQRARELALTRVRTLLDQSPPETVRLEDIVGVVAVTVEDAVEREVERLREALEFCIERAEDTNSSETARLGAIHFWATHACAVLASDPAAKSDRSTDSDK